MNDTKPHCNYCSTTKGVRTSWVDIEGQQHYYCDSCFEYNFTQLTEEQSDALLNTINNQLREKIK